MIDRVTSFLIGMGTGIVIALGGVILIMKLA